jgi:hypothetical protein
LLARSAGVELNRFDFLVVASLAAALAVGRPLLLAGLAEVLGAFDSHFVTVNLADSAE